MVLGSQEWPFWCFDGRTPFESIVATATQNQAGGEESWHAHEIVEPPKFAYIPRDIRT